MGGLDLNEKMGVGHAQLPAQQACRAGASEPRPRGGGGERDARSSSAGAAMHWPRLGGGIAKVMSSSWNATGQPSGVLRLRQRFMPGAAVGAACRGATSDNRLLPAGAGPHTTGAASFLHPAAISSRRLRSTPMQAGEPPAAPPQGPDPASTRSPQVGCNWRTATTTASSALYFFAL